MYAERALQGVHPDVWEMAPELVGHWVHLRGLGQTERLIEAHLKDPRRTPTQRAAWRVFMNTLETWKDRHAYTDHYERSRRILPPLGETARYAQLQPLWFSQFHHQWIQYLTLSDVWDR